MDEPSKIQNSTANVGKLQSMIAAIPQFDPQYPALVSSRLAEYAAREKLIAGLVEVLDRVMPSFNARLLDAAQDANLYTFLQNAVVNFVVAKY